MDHQDAKELFSQHLDEELPKETQAELEAHLADCPSCREELEGLKKTLNSLASLAPLPPPEQFVRKVQQRIHRRSRGRFFTSEHALSRIPFEWISFLIIILMMMLYFMVLQSELKTVKPASDKEPTTNGSVKRIQKKAPERVQKKAPERVQKKAPERVQKKAPERIQKKAPKK